MMGALTKSLAHGARPDPVGRDPRSDGFLILPDRASALDAAGAQAFLRELSHAVSDVTARVGRARVATAAVGSAPFVRHRWRTATQDRDSVIAREVQLPAGVQPAPDASLTISKRREALPLDNRAHSPQPGYAGA